VHVQSPATQATAAPDTAGPVPGPPRRQVLRGAAGVSVLAGVALVAGCGSDDAGGTPTGAPSGGDRTLTPTSAVPVGGGVIVGAVVVTQPTAGDFKGFSSTCTHKGCTVESVAGGEIICPCHGSRYSVTDGSPTRGPATAPLPEVAVTVDGTDVVRA